MRERNRGLKANRVLTLDWLVEWAAGKLGVPYLHIDPLKIDLGAVTAIMDLRARADGSHDVPELAS